MAFTTFVTTNIPVTAFVTTPSVNVWLTTNVPFTTFVTTPVTSIFVTTNRPVTTFVTTFGPQQTTLLTLDPGITSQSSDCKLITFQDNTGYYPEIESGYNLESNFSELPDRAKRSEVQLWAAFQYFDLVPSGNSLVLSLVNLPNPSVQNNNDPWSFSYSPTASGVYKMFLIGAPIGENYANWVGSSSLIQTAQTTPNWFVSELIFTVDCEINNCVNDARRRLVDAMMCGKCKTKEWQDKRALQSTYLYNLALANTNPITPADKIISDQFAFKALVVRKALEELCKDSGCQCNCNC